MPPLPKKKHTRARKHWRTRRYILSKPALGICPECGEIKAPHRVCSSCGYYRGQHIVQTTGSELEE